MLADRIPHGSLAGRVLRWPLRLVPGEVPRRILAGPARGLSWHPASGPHGIWLGLYERRFQARFARSVREGDVVWDVGAHAGLYALVAARRGARVFAFEPLESNTAWLRRNLAVNGLEERVAVQAFALGAREDRLGWSGDPTGMEGRPDPGRPGPVRVVAADALDLPAPDVLKVDVEGGELDVLAGARRCLEAKRPVLFVEVHAPATAADCLALLPGYRSEELEPRRFVLAPAEGPPPGRAGGEG